jgi:hypothetical protein
MDDLRPADSTSRLHVAITTFWREERHSGGAKGSASSWRSLFGDMTGHSVLHDILARGEGFGQRQHLELLDHHFSRSRLASDEARTTCIEPDLRPMPALTV